MASLIDVITNRNDVTKLQAQNSVSSSTPFNFFGVIKSTVSKCSYPPCILQYSLQIPQFLLVPPQYLNYEQLRRPDH